MTGSVVTAEHHTSPCEVMHKTTSLLSQQVHNPLSVSPCSLPKPHTDPWGTSHVLKPGLVQLRRGSAAEHSCVSIMSLESQHGAAQGPGALSPCWALPNSCSGQLSQHPPLPAGWGFPCKSLPSLIQPRSSLLGQDCSFPHRAGEVNFTLKCS